MWFGAAFTNLNVHKKDERKHTRKQRPTRTSANCHSNEEGNNSNSKCPLVEDGDAPIRCALFPTSSGHTRARAPLAGRFLLLPFIFFFIPRNETLIKMTKKDGRSEQADGRERPAAGGGAYHGRGRKSSKVSPMKFVPSLKIEALLIL